MTEFIEIKANAISIGQRKLVYGVGVNDAWYKTYIQVDGKQVVCPYYRKWKDMLKRSTAISSKLSDQRISVRQW